MITVGYRNGQRLLLLAMLVAGLLAGLVGTHHLPVEQSAVMAAMQAGEHGETPTPLRHDDDPSGDHSGVVHLCLAILAAGALIVALVLVWRRLIPALLAVSDRVNGARSTPRAPPPTAPGRLALLCVLRT